MAYMMFLPPPVNPPTDRPDELALTLKYCGQPPSATLPQEGEDVFVVRYPKVSISFLKIGEPATWIWRPSNDSNDASNDPPYQLPEKLPCFKPVAETHRKMNAKSLTEVKRFKLTLWGIGILGVLATASTSLMKRAPDKA